MQPILYKGTLDKIRTGPRRMVGAWARKEVTPVLERKGNQAYPVTLTGMGERVHLATNDIGVRPPSKTSLM